jgi:uncharacterized protein YecT (DUF1311 family)
MMTMPSFSTSLHKLHLSPILILASFFLMTLALLPNAAAQLATTQDGGPPPHSQDPSAQDLQSQAPQTQVSNYDKAIFQKPIPADQLAFLNHFAGSPSNDIVRDRQYRKLMHAVIPDCVFHYGWDMSIPDALEKVFAGSTLPVQIRDGRYVIVSGRSGPYLQGRAFMWIDMQDGIALGGFYFHPTNGEPTPTVTIFSRQVKEESLKLSQLPPAFVEDLAQWSAESRVPPVTTRYFITASNRKILLEHDEDYCASIRGTAASTDDCEQMNADAADIDLNAAYYLDQTNHATNATAWMITGEEQIAWLQVRDDTCRLRPDWLRCRIRLTHERTYMIINRHAVPAQHPSHK